jgi:hypothetical protein
MCILEAGPDNFGTRHTHHAIAMPTAGGHSVVHREAGASDSSAAS